MLVEEIFGNTIQGEGVHIGSPTTFVRFVGCTRNCKWCDTGYGDIKRDIPQKRMDASMIASKVIELNNRHVVLTGGEPMIQPTSELADLASRLLVRDHFITVETNGDIVPDEDFIKKVDLFSISPKLGSSGVSNFKELSNNLFSYHIRGAQMSVKFVVDLAEKDELEVMRYMDFFKQHKITDFPIIIQPKDGKINDIAPIFEKLHSYVKSTRLAVKFLPQLHKAIGIR
jgi:7-cyano-7-deazaguanosine (preQ0) biosynthesis protein QueE